MDVGPFADKFKPFYIGSEETGFRLRPEFIRGIYNAETHSFVENANYYQNLDESTRKQLFEDIRLSYIKSYAEFSNVNPRETIEPLPLNEEEMDAISIEWYKEQLKKLREDRTFSAEKLDEGLHDMAGEINKSDFDDAKHSIEKSTRDDREDELNHDGWEVDDDWN